MFAPVRPLAVAAAALTILTLSITPASTASSDTGRTRLLDRFAGPDRLLTNGYATWNPGDRSAARSSTWEMANGSLFRRRGIAWTGRPDDCHPDARSARCNNSVWFHLRTRQANFRDVQVGLELRTLRLVSTDSTPPQDWDGVHIWLRYLSEQHLYVASVNQRDGKVFVKKKCPGGAQNGGTYHVFAQATKPIPLGQWQQVSASALNNADGSVTISIDRDGRRILTVTDRGELCAPIRAAGRVGVRGTNAEFEFDDFRVRSLR